MHKDELATLAQGLRTLRNEIGVNELSIKVVGPHCIVITAENRFPEIERSFAQEYDLNRWTDEHTKTSFIDHFKAEAAEAFG